MGKRFLMAAFIAGVSIDLLLLFFVVHDHWFFEEPEWDFLQTVLDRVTSRLGQGLVGVSILASLYAGLKRSPEDLGRWILRLLRRLTHHVSVLSGLALAGAGLAYLFFSGVRFHPPISQDSSSVLITPDGSEAYVALAVGENEGVVLWRELKTPETGCGVMSISADEEHAWHAVKIGQETGKQEPFTWTAGRPAQLAYVPRTDQILVTDELFNSIVVISRRSHRAVHIISGVGFAPRSIVITADGHKAYVSSEQPLPEGRIAVIDLLSQPYPRLTGTAISVPAPQGMAIRGRRLYVATEAGAGRDPVFMVNTTTDRVLDWLPGFATGLKVAIGGESGERLYVTHGLLGAINISGRKLQLGHAPALAATGVIAVTEDRRTVLLDSGSQLTEFDANTNKIGASVAVELKPSTGTPPGLAISGGRAYAWSPGEGNLYTFEVNSPPPFCRPPQH